MKCKKHPTYKAIRYPWSECPECLEIYKKKNEDYKRGFKEGQKSAFKSIEGANKKIYEG